MTTRAKDQRTRIEEIIWCEGQAEEIIAEAEVHIKTISEEAEVQVRRVLRKAEAEAEEIRETAEHDADELRFRAAQLIYQEKEDGKTERAIAQEIGKSNSHVHYMYQVHKITLAHPHRAGEQERSFQDLYDEVQAVKPAERDKVVLGLLAEGQSKRATAKQLGIDEKTVRAVAKRYEKREIHEIPVSASCIRNGPYREGFEDELLVLVEEFTTFIEELYEDGGFVGNESGRIKLELKNLASYVTRCEKAQQAQGEEK